MQAIPIKTGDTKAMVLGSNLYGGDVPPGFMCDLNVVNDSSSLN